MADIKYYDDIPSSYYSEKYAIGTRAICFFIKDNLVFKEFVFGEKPPIQQLSYFSSLDFKQIIMPKEIIYTGGNVLRGYTMDFVDGTLLEEHSLEIPIDIFFKQIKLFEEKVLNLTSKKIKLSDINPKNMIWTDDNLLYFIDTDAYMIGEVEYKSNVLEFNLGFRQLLASYKYRDDSINIYMGDIDLNQLYLDTFVFGNKKVSDFIEVIITYFNKRNIEIKTVADFKDKLEDLVYQTKKSR